ncbi:hypothetical protein [Microbacterium hibisci]|uniref:hypothetical protein n=1 Tax=Microbacterium hibisci TaxID=2036000 RepID=UPI001940CC03|nr:hypothetical protein [Microbacterium hibisci]
MRSPKGHELRQLDGNAGDLWTRGDGLVKLGLQMDRTATALADIADSSVHKSQGTDKLAEMADETADDLAKAAVRYEDTGRVLRTYADALSTAQTWIRTNQSSVEQAERDYQSAIDARDSADRELSGIQTVMSWEAEPSASEKSSAETAAHNAAAALTTATNHRDEMWGSFDQVFETWEDAYEDAVSGIQKAMDTAGNNDGFWEFIDNALEVLGWVLLALTVIALIIGAPLAGLLGAIIFGLALLVFALNALKFAFGRATLGDLGLAALSLLPFGIGRVLSKGAPVLSTVIRGGRSVATGVIRSAIPRMQLLRPTTWGKPFQWLAAPFRARAGLPSPGMWTNPLRTMAFGDAKLTQTHTFLGTMAKSPWGQSPAVQQFVANTNASMPNFWIRTANVSVWLGSAGLDTTQAVKTSFGVGPDLTIPGLDQVKLSW